MSEQRIELAEYIKHLRRQITKASREGEGKSVRFDVETLELELQIVVERSKEGKAGIKSWILSVGGAAARKDEVTQTIKLSLRPTTPDGTSTQLRRGAGG